MSESQTKELLKLLENDLIQSAQQANKIGYNPSVFFRMISEYGGYQTAKKLINSSKITDGLVKLFEKGRLDLTVEAIILNPKYKSLFSFEERAIAKERLEQYGFDTSKILKNDESENTEEQTVHNKVDEDLQDAEFVNEVETQLKMIDRAHIKIIDKIEEAPEVMQGSIRGYKRNVKKPAEVIVNAQFKCEVNQDHRSFKSKTTGENYCEGHHLIPMSHQARYNVSLDVHANIVSLCPNCHRTLHHGVLEESKIILEKLFNDRKSRLKSCGINISLSDLIDLYK